MSERIAPLLRLVHTQRSRWQRLQWMEAVGMAVSALVAWFLVAVLLDNLARLPALGRWAAAAGLIAAAVWGGRRLLHRWRQSQASDDEVALAIEGRTTGGVQNRLINALQIGREADEASTAALVQENLRQLEQKPLAGATNSRPALISAAIAAGLVAVLLVGFLIAPARFGASASRILLPFASIDAFSRTKLIVAPGDIEAIGDVKIEVQIRGEHPSELVVLLQDKGQTATHVVPVPAGADTVEYTIPNVDRSLMYAVRGGDFTSAYYRIDVPTPSRLARVHATYHYPAYTKLADKTGESSGDLEAVQGTKADVKFVLDHPADSATLVLRGAAVAGKKAEERRVPLKGAGGSEFLGEIAFADVVEYRLETKQGSRPIYPTAWHSVRVVVDEPPKLELTGLPSTGELPLDAPVPLQAAAQDDFGLTKCGLFLRRPSAGNAKAADEGWTPLAEWKPSGELKLAQTAEWLSANQGMVEGDRLELALRAQDNFPERAGKWTTGQVHGVIVAGEGTQLQLLYEQILRTESELSNIATAGNDLHQKTDALVRRLDADPSADGNAPDKVKELVDWAMARTKEQTQLKETMGQVAREMTTQAGSLRLSLGMLADTELIRAQRVFDSVPTRDDATGRRAAFTEARATQKRILQSLTQIQEQYVHFRQDWETAHMIPFVRMLADRQAALRDTSKKRVDAKGDVPAIQREAGARRQAKIAELAGLAAVAFQGMAERTQSLEAELSEAFTATSDSLEGDELKQPIDKASKALSSGDWTAAHAEQVKAAELLEQIHARLIEAQTEAAKRVLAAVEERTDSEMLAQGELEKLKEGVTEDMLDEPAGLKLTNLIHLAEVVQKAKTGEEKPYVENYVFPDSAVASLQQPDRGIRQQFENLKLGSTPTTTPSFPNSSDRQGNRVKPHIQEDFEDLVGKLLEEEDEMKANYETYNLNAAFNINEPGEIGKQGGDLNSTAAAAATGNMKPPTTNVGGASRVGRQGARAHGAAVGNESINRRGRDKVQEGQEKVADQAGSVKETKSDDPQKDTSTGIGGRKVESDDAKFSQNDAGEWSDDMVGRMEKAKDTYSIVERQGKKLDASIGDMMRDMTSKQVQTIERVKSIRKELKNLYLPTEHLDDIINQLQANLHSLNERPTAEVFRLQQQALEQARGALQVFHQAHSGFQASVPREQMVRGRVLDDPARSPPPGYEEAVRNYYRRLATP